jgi:Na+-translocating ferredoxin:NAD+ oxidoreductase subunit G
VIKFTAILAGVCAAAAIVLSFTYSITRPAILSQSEKETRQALEKVIPGADDYAKKSFNDKDYYECYKDKRLMGYALFASSKGYSGDIKMLFGINLQGTVLGVEILSQSETPGLGARCVEIKRNENSPWFLKQFIGKHAASLHINDIQTITGSTITSKAVLEGVRDNAKAFLNKIK